MAPWSLEKRGLTMLDSSRPNISEIWLVLNIGKMLQVSWSPSIRHRNMTRVTEVVEPSGRNILKTRGVRHPSSLISATPVTVNSEKEEEEASGRGRRWLHHHAYF